MVSTIMMHWLASFEKAISSLFAQQRTLPEILHLVSKINKQTFYFSKVRKQWGWFIVVTIWFPCNLPAQSKHILFSSSSEQHRWILLFFSFDAIYDENKDITDEDFISCDFIASNRCNKQTNNDQPWADNGLGHDSAQTILVFLVAIQAIL